MWFIREFITYNSLLIWKFGRIFLPPTVEKSKSLKVFFIAQFFLMTSLILGTEQHSHTFYFCVRRIFIGTTISRLYIVYRCYLLILKTFGIYYVSGCSLHDWVYSSNRSGDRMDGWMDSWVFERATFQQMLKAVSPHTSRDTLLCCIVDVVCVWRVQHALCWKQKERSEGSGRMWWNEARILSDTIYIYACIHVYRLYCHMNYICSWAHNGCEPIYYMGWDGFLHTRFPR